MLHSSNGFKKRKKRKTCSLGMRRGGRLSWNEQRNHGTRRTCESILDFDRALCGSWWPLFHVQIELQINQSQVDQKILIYDSYWSCISLGGEGRSIIFFDKLGEQIR